MESLPPSQSTDPATRKRLVITVHGIRTFGSWQDKLDQKICAEFGKDIEVFPYRYRYLTIFAFFIPFLRWKVARDFESALRHQLNRKDLSRIDIVAHSFGTYVVGRSLLRLAPLKYPVIHTVIFAASVLQDSFPVRELVGTRINRLVNDCGIRDWVLVLNRFVIPGLGAAGFFGITGFEGEHFRNRYFKLGHSGYFQDSDVGKKDFVSTYWLQLLRPEAEIVRHDERPQKGYSDLFVLFLNNAEIIKLIFYLLIVILPFVYVNNLRLTAKHEANAALSRQLAAESSLMQAENPDLEPAALLAAESMERLPQVSADQQIRATTKLIPHQTWSVQEGTRISGIAFSPNGRYVATGSFDKTACVFGSNTGEEVSCRDFGNGVAAVAFSPDSRLVAAAVLDHTARVFEASGRKEMPHLTQLGPVVAVAFSPDGRYIAIGTDTDARVLEATTGKEVSRLIHKGYVRAVIFSPNGRYVATASYDHGARVFEAASGKELWNFTFANQVNAVAFSADGRYVASGSEDHTVGLFETKRGGKLFRRDAGGVVDAVAFSPDGRYLTTANHNHAIRVFNAVTGDDASEFHVQGPLSGIAYSPDGRYVASGSSVFELATNKEVARLTHQATIWAIAPDGRQVISSSWNDGSVRMFEMVNTGGASTLDKLTSDEKKEGDFKAGVLKLILKVNDLKLFTAVAFSSDGQYVAAGHADKRVRVFRTRDGTEVSHSTYDEIVGAVAFSPDSKYVATGSYDNSVRVFEAQTGNEVSQLNSFGSVIAVAFSPDGQFIASGDTGKTVRVSKALDGEEVWHQSQDGGVNTVAFSPNGRYVATGSFDHTARVFDVATGKEVSRLTLLGIVLSVTFSPDSRLVAAVSQDNTVRVFEASSGIEKSHLTFNETPASVHFASDGRYLFTTSREPASEVTRHLLQPQDLVGVVCTLVTRNLTSDEWKQYVGNSVPYHRTCQNLP